MFTLRPAFFRASTGAFNATKSKPIAAMSFSTEGKHYVTDKAELNPSVHPKIAKRGSYKVFMEPGKTYFWCTCGQSENQPWCDGSHKGSEFLPYKFTYDGEAKVKSICGCKMNRDDRGEKCDRSHLLVDFDNLDKYKPDWKRDPDWLEIWNKRNDLH